ncbi:uncharacterized protein LOC116617277 [Nematostella vectensis]|uniref:uncharacterized protein LOC116617277 n=1 Tax=Nematostella vectensis TaxID=45351 RepID=UPI002076F23F|nr:uncharacterized protein LOC116617277 [Nematostella vectensis]
MKRRIHAILPVVALCVALSLANIDNGEMVERSGPAQPPLSHLSGKRASTWLRADPEQSIEMSRPLQPVDALEKGNSGKILQLDKVPMKMMIRQFGATPPSGIGRKRTNFRRYPPLNAVGKKREFCETRKDIRNNAILD